ncbi:MAG: hypothetical protein PVSMB1_03900 [Gemmatimonadaceae bacterium]
MNMAVIRSAYASTSRGGGGLAVLSLLMALFGTACALVYRQTYKTFTTPTPLAVDEYLVLGFLGGLEAWNSEDQGVRKLALQLRAKNLAGVHVETVEDRKRALALALIRRAFDRNRDGILDPQERRSVRLILYGMSFGGAAVVKLARQLKAMDIPVLLTVQVDSVGRDDAVIPSNVAAAANLYQTEGVLIRGERTIRAEDPSKTEILGNFLFTYRGKKVDLSAIRWYKTIFRRAHAKMNADPAVWAKVEDLITEVASHGTVGAGSRVGWSNHGVQLPN